MGGQLQIFDDHGSLLKKEKYSDFTDTPQNDEGVDELQMDAGKVSADGKDFCFSRYKPDDKNIFYELTLMDFDGEVLLQNKINSWYGRILKVSDDKKIITVFEWTFASGMDRYVGYDFKGKLLWVTQKPRSAFINTENAITGDGKFIKLVNGNKLDLLTGEIINQ
jgi:hypothetical protein